MSNGPTGQQDEERIMADAPHMEKVTFRRRGNDYCLYSAAKFLVLDIRSGRGEKNGWVDIDFGWPRLPEGKTYEVGFGNPGFGDKVNMPANRKILDNLPEDLQHFGIVKIHPLDGIQVVKEEIPDEYHLAILAFVRDEIVKKATNQIQDALKKGGKVKSMLLVEVWRAAQRYCLHNANHPGMRGALDAIQAVNENWLRAAARLQK